MKKQFLIGILFFFIVHSFSQSCDIVGTYKDFIFLQKQTVNNKTIFTPIVLNISDTCCYSDLLTVPKRANITYFANFLLTFTTVKTQDFSQWEDSVAIQNEYIKRLQNDSIFTPIMKEWSDKTIHKTVSKDSISMNRLLDIAVKYFTITKINTSGDYIGKICGNINLIAKTEKERTPFLETFCTVTILNNYYSRGEFDTYIMFMEGIKELYTLSLGLDKDERLLRAQGAMCMLMKNNPKLRQLLVIEYEANKENLPFILQY